MKAAGGRLRGVVLAFVFWTAVSLVFVLPLLGRSANLGRTLLAALVQWWLWGLLAPGIVAVDRALRFPGERLGMRVASHLAIGACVALLYSYLLAVVRALLRLGDWSQTHSHAVLVEAGRDIFWSLLVYFMIVGATQAYSYQQRYLSARIRAERSERMASEARLHALRSQLDPHFLFNTLNGISAYVERDPRLARSMIEQLGDLLRLSLKSQGRESISLREELAFVEHYLALQKMRYRDRLRIEMDIAADAREALVPSLLLQPLVENAICHGIAPLTGGGSLTISARIAAGQLLLGVVDDGVGLTPGWSIDDQTGMGLRLTRERLAVRDPGSQGRFEVLPGAVGGVEVRIALPLRFMEEAP
ncbi:sensor histidine kinase [Granulicella rosea]|nr:histidine kinase [Granulicella rosea]